MISSVYTIQFINPSKRQQIYKKIYNSLNWGIRTFFLFEKVRGPDARFQDILTGTYNDYKLDEGYNYEEITIKTQSLRGVLEPFSTNGNLGLLKRAGFKDILIIFKYICFELLSYKIIIMSNKENEILKRKEKALEVIYELVPPFPEEYLIDISSLCNHTCTFCSNRKMQNKSNANSDLVFKILKEAKNEGAKSVGLYATGEPFLNKDLEKFIDYAKNKMNYDYVYITTNGAACTPKRMKTAIENGLDSIKFSIHGGTSKTYKNIHGK